MNPLSNIDDMENIFNFIYIYRWILYQTWWSSMAMFNYQRVSSGFSDFLGFLTFRQTHVVIFSVMAVKHNVLITQVMFKHVSSDSFWYLSILLPQYCKSYEQRIPPKIDGVYHHFPSTHPILDSWWCVYAKYIPNMTYAFTFPCILIILWPPLWHMNHICWVRIPSDHHSVTWWYCFLVIIIIINYHHRRC